MSKHRPVGQGRHGVPAVFGLEHVTAVAELLRDSVLVLRQADCELGGSERSLLGESREHGNDEFWVLWRLRRHGIQQTRRRRCDLKRVRLRHARPVELPRLFRRSLRGRLGRPEASMAGCQTAVRLVTVGPCTVRPLAAAAQASQSKSTIALGVPRASSSISSPCGGGVLPTPTGPTRRSSFAIRGSYGISD